MVPVKEETDKFSFLIPTSLLGGEKKQHATCSGAETEDESERQTGG